MRCFFTVHGVEPRETVQMKIGNIFKFEESPLLRVKQGHVCLGRAHKDIAYLPLPSAASLFYAVWLSFPDWSAKIVFSSVWQYPCRMSAIHEDCSHYFENDLKSRRCWNQIIYVDHPETYCLRDKLCEFTYTVNREVNFFSFLQWVLIAIQNILNDTCVWAILC